MVSDGFFFSNFAAAKAPLAQHSGANNQEDKTMEHIIRKAGHADSERIWQIITDAKRLMAERGSTQWTESYPSTDAIEADICSGHAFVACDRRQVAVAYAVITTEPEAAYADICGRWLTSGPYVTVHRLAVADGWRGRGLARALMARAELEARSVGATGVRVDTNHDNAAMLALLPAMGYELCGTVSYGPRGERIAFEKAVAH